MKGNIDVLTIMIGCVNAEKNIERGTIKFIFEDGKILTYANFISLMEKLKVSFLFFFNCSFCLLFLALFVGIKYNLLVAFHECYISKIIIVVVLFVPLAVRTSSTKPVITVQ